MKIENVIPKEMAKPKSLEDKIENLTCHMCRKEKHMIATVYKSPNYGLCWKFDSPCHTRIHDNMANAFNILARKSGLF